MDNKQIAAVLLIIAGYYYLHSKGWTKYAQQTKQTAGSRPNTVSSGASTRATTNRVIPGGASPIAGTGRGIVAAPVRNIGQANAPMQSAAGTGIVRRQLSSSWSGVATKGISPSWPTSQVTSTKSIRISSGRVQVPGYAAIPTTTIGPGGQGTLLNFAGGTA